MTRKTKGGDPGDALLDLKSRLVFTLSFFERTQDFPSGPEMLAIVEDAAARGDMRALRLIAREIEAMTVALAPQERDGLEALLREHLGIDTEAERSAVRKQVAAVIARGSVASEKERRRLEDYAEMLEATGGNPDELRAVRRLVASK